MQTQFYTVFIVKVFFLLKITVNKTTTTTTTTSTTTPTL